MKDVELKLISEIMKNSRRSDRELAKAIGTSQPTVTRIRNRLEKEEYLKEYAAIPDFRKLGFEIIAITFTTFLHEPTPQEFGAFRGAARELEKKNPRAVLMAANGMGLGFNRVFISFHENYSSYMKTISLIKQVPNVDKSHVESFVVSLADEGHYQPLTFSVIAKYLQTRNGKRE
jgi:DNA-binding Lrp family transcriptional regulator